MSEYADPGPDGVAPRELPWPDIEPARNQPSFRVTLDDRPVRRITARVHVEYTLFGVAGDSGIPALDSLSSGTSLAVPFPGGAVLLTGIHTGNATVSAETHPEAPEQVDRSSTWESITEVSIQTADGPLRVCSLMSDAPIALSGLTPPNTVAWYRMRAHARGRDTLPDGVATEPVEDYLIQLWPAPATPPAVLLDGDRAWAHLTTGPPSAAGPGATRPPADRHLPDSRAHASHGTPRTTAEIDRQRSMADSLARARLSTPDDAPER